MEHDFLKKYIQQNRDAFDDQELPSQAFSQIMGKVKKETVQSKRAFLRPWLAIACSLFIVIGAFLFMNKQEKPEQALTIAGIKPTASLVDENHDNLKGAEENGYVAKTVKTLAKHSIANHKTYDKTEIQQIYHELNDSTSVATRLSALLKANTLHTISKELKVALCRTFNHDENDNVRLAALNILSKIKDDSYINENLKQSLTLQTDPFIQIELVKIMGDSKEKETDQKLMEMASNPATIEVVKEQVYYALLTKQ
ncbi:HEAT repeat domain-containing protein [Pedobacter montanisoli]|uniref:HEAT repeat domain-containing protein n=1 Tax=Pedobacter montanisoli TaxID=2923277 RepID=A0ABS9ZSH0_9SPHI|nr:HEAT repeat domain-containing protein [Pedobacter montanisoli]MCJ0741540.1 HEAT repeat domain-containing protein [Pedobacter montanisoli]